MRHNAFLPTSHTASAIGSRYTSPMAPPPRKRQRRKPASSTQTRPHVRAPRPAARPAGPADSSTRASRVLDWLLQKLPLRQREKAHDYLVLTRMDRPIGALLLLI